MSEGSTNGLILNWATLRAGTHNASTFEIPTLALEASTPNGPLRQALGADNELRFLVPLAYSESIRNLPDTPSLRIVTTQLKSNSSLQRFLDVTCTDLRLESVFAEFVSEITNRINSGSLGTAAVESTLNDFRKLLLEKANPRIEDQSIIGLTAELLVLDRLLAYSSDAWRTWRGPQLDRHDFRRGDLSLEVKGSSSVSQNRIYVHGLNQLAIPNNGSLFLTRLILEPVTGGLIDIKTLTTNLLKKCSEPEELEKLLAQVGVIDDSLDQWSRLTFRLESQSHYHVTKNFPRITESSFAEGAVTNGIGNVSYSIDLSLAEECLISGDQFTQVEQKLVSAF